MRVLLYPPNPFLLLTYAALSAVPFVRVLFGLPVEHPLQTLGIELLAWIAVWAAFGRPARFHWLLLPAFLALPAELYLLKYYGQGISTHHIGILFETSPMEATEYLGSTLWPVCAVLAAVLLWWLMSLVAAQRTRELDWDDGSRKLALALLAAGALSLAWGYEFGVAAPQPAAAVRMAGLAPPASGKAAAAPPDKGAGLTGLGLPPLPHWARMPFDVDAFAHSWPFGVMARGVDFVNERRHLARLNERSREFRFHATQSGADNEPQVVIMVLGESSRADRWSLFGYERDTTPLLAGLPNVVPLPDVVTAVSATRLAVPVIISRKPARQSLVDGFNEKSFISAFSEAGFKTYWLSNQVSFSKFDTPVSVFAQEADVVEFFNLGDFTNKSTFDEVLLDPLKQALADEAPKKLIVLHTLGSHWNYSHRYPPRFDMWQPSLWGVEKPVPTDRSIKERMNNSYDSSVLYTDWFLSSVIERVKATHQVASMLYVADHGQSLYDNSCKLVFHGHNTQYDFHVPAFAWYSDAYAKRYPDKVAQLRAHRTAKLSTENMFHTLLDMGAVRYPGEQPARSFANARFAPHTRYVDSYGWTDYDNASFEGACREVIGKGKPRPARLD